MKEQETPVLVVESRPCGDCKYFSKDAGSNIMGSCYKKLMTVLSTLKVVYKESEGTCFVPEDNHTTTM